MVDDDDEPVTDSQAIDRVESIGSIAVHRAPVERDDLNTWRRGLRSLARERGFRISVRHVRGLTYVIYNPDYVVSREQLRATVAALPIPDILRTATPTTRPTGRGHLRAVTDDT